MWTLKFLFKFQFEFLLFLISLTETEICMKKVKAMKSLRVHTSHFTFISLKRGFINLISFLLVLISSPLPKSLVTHYSVFFSRHFLFFFFFLSLFLSFSVTSFLLSFFYFFLIFFILPFFLFSFLGATKHLYNWLCPLVGWSLGRSIDWSVSH